MSRASYNAIVEALEKTHLSLAQVAPIVAAMLCVDGDESFAQAFLRALQKQEASHPVKPADLLPEGEHVFVVTAASVLPNKPTLPALHHTLLALDCSALTNGANARLIGAVGTRRLNAIWATLGVPEPAREATLQQCVDKLFRATVRHVAYNGRWCLHLEHVCAFDGGAHG